MKSALINILIFSNFLFAQSDLVNQKYSVFGLKDLINSGLKFNSRLEPIELEKKVLSARINQVNKQPSPMLEFMVDYLPVNFENAGEYSLFYTQPLKLSGKPGAEENLAKLNVSKTGIDKKGIENELIKSIKENYFLLSVNEKLLEINYEYREILNSITKSIEIKYSVGKGNQYEIMKSNNEFQKLMLEEIDLKNNKSILINNLRTLSNLNLEDNFQTKDVELLLMIPPPEMDSSGLINSMKNNNTDFLSIEYMKEENTLEKNISKLERNPDISLTGGYRYLSEMKSSKLLFSVSIDLPFMPWNSKRIDAALQEKSIKEKKLFSEARALEQNLKTDLKNILVKINSSLEKMNYIRNILIPQTEQTFKSALIGYESASLEFIDLMDAFKSLKDNNKVLIEEETNYLILISDMEKLIGKQILTIN